MAPGLLIRIILGLCEESNEKHKGTLGMGGHVILALWRQSQEGSGVRVDSWQEELQGHRGQYLNCD